MDETTWTEFVRRALIDEDHEALRALFAQAELTWGHQAASERWFRLTSEGDAGAQTG